MKSPLRDFSTIEEDPFITIDGVAYTLKVHMDANTALDLRDVGEEYNTISEKRGSERTAEDKERIVELLEVMMKAAVDAPKEVIDKLDDSQKAAIFQLAMEEVNRRGANPTTDAPSSPDSRGSMERVTG